MGHRDWRMSISSASTVVVGCVGLDHAPWVVPTGMFLSDGRRSHIYSKFFGNPSYSTKKTLPNARIVGTKGLLISNSVAQSQQCMFLK